MKESEQLYKFWKEDLTVLDPVIYSGKYHSLGKLLGKIGEIPADYQTKNIK